jgi:hypothetical protein
MQYLVKVYQQINPHDMLIICKKYYLSLIDKNIYTQSLSCRTLNLRGIYFLLSLMVILLLLPLLPICIRNLHAQSHTKIHSQSLQAHTTHVQLCIQHASVPLYKKNGKSWDKGQVLAPDLYVKVWHNDVLLLRSSVCKNNQVCTWNTCLPSTLLTYNELVSQAPQLNDIKIEIWDEDLLRDDFVYRWTLGEVIQANKMNPMTDLLQKKSLVYHAESKAFYADELSKVSLKLTGESIAPASIVSPPTSIVSPPSLRSTTVIPSTVPTIPTATAKNHKKLDVSSEISNQKNSNEKVMNLKANQEASVESSTRLIKCNTLPPPIKDSELRWTMDQSLPFTQIQKRIQKTLKLKRTRLQSLRLNDIKLHLCQQGLYVKSGLGQIWIQSKINDSQAKLIEITVHRPRFFRMLLSAQTLKTKIHKLLCIHVFKFKSLDCP